MAFRILNQAPQYLLPDGRVNAGGSLSFFETDLSTPKDTWSDPELSTLNSNPVVMDADGRTLTDVWGDGEYGVVMKDAAGNVIWTRNHVREAGGAGSTIPDSGDPDTFLTWDGAQYLLVPILQVPDPTGLANYQLESDGTGIPVWVQKAEPPDIPEPVVTSGSFNFGGMLFQWGTGTVPANASGQTNNVTVSFPIEFATTPTFCTATPSSGSGSTVSGRIPSLAASSPTTEQMTVTANVGEDDTQSQYKLSLTTPFWWLAIGEAVEE